MEIIDRCNGYPASGLPIVTGIAIGKDMSNCLKSMTPDGTGGTQSRWLLPSGEILEWDRQHGELEKYDKTGKNHLGAFDLNTGAQLKPARSERNIRRFLN